MARRAIARKARRNKVQEAKIGSAALILGTLLVVVALPLCVVVTVGMAPSIVAAITDRNPRRYLTRILGMLNLSGMVLPLVSFLKGGFTVVSAAMILTDPYKWLWMYGASALGWLIYLSMPPVGRVMIEARAAKTEQDLQARMKVLVEEWGPEVTGHKK